MVKWFAALAPDPGVYAARIAEIDRATHDDPDDYIERFLQERAARAGRQDA
jgi:hypothetical protein